MRTPLLALAALTLAGPALAGWPETWFQWYGNWTERPQYGYEGTGPRFMRSDRNGQCADLLGGQRTPGQELTTRACTGADTQVFHFGSNNRLTSGELCVTARARGEPRKKEIKVTLQPCVANDNNQAWTLQWGVILNNVGQGGALDLFLETNNPDVEANRLVVWGWHNGANQHWLMMPTNKDAKILFSSATVSYGAGSKAGSITAFASLENKPPGEGNLRTLAPGGSFDVRLEPGAAQHMFFIVPDGSGQRFEWRFRDQTYQLPQGWIYYKSPSCMLQGGSRLNLEGTDAGLTLTQKTARCDGFDSGAPVAFDAPPEFAYSGRRECRDPKDDLAWRKRACLSQLAWEPPGHDYWRAESPVDLGPFRYCDAGGESWAYNDGRLSPGGAVEGVPYHFGFHTPWGANQWWFVDLGGSVLVKSLKVRKRDNCCWSRSSHWVVDLSDDAEAWREATLTKESRTCIEDESVVSCKVDLERPESARFVRLRHKAGDYFHLGQVQVYGCD